LNDTDLRLVADTLQRAIDACEAAEAWPGPINPAYVADIAADIRIARDCILSGQLCATPVELAPRKKKGSTFR
jgi:hypothetical protein